MNTTQSLSNRLRILFALAVALTGSWGVQISAQSTAFTYQGRLNTGNAPANGLYEITFSLHDAVVDGGVVGTPVTLAPVPVSNGFFTAALDFGAAAFSGANRWLEIAVTVFGTDQPVITLAPRQPITPAPYSLHAANAGSALTLGGLGPDNFWRLDGNAGTTAGTHFLGTTDNRPLEFKVNGVTALQIHPTSSGIPTIVLGAGNGVDGQYSISRGCIVSGGGGNYLEHGPFSTVQYAVIAGGQDNLVGGRWNVIGGGNQNKVRGLATASVIGGGDGNVMGVYASRCVIAGGFSNTMEGRSTTYCTISGGSMNTILPRPTGGGADGDTISGGMNNTNSGGFGATIAGGTDNYIGARNTASTISGGRENVITDDAPYATVPGGFQAAARRYGQVAHASGSFAANGDAQTSTFVCRNTTTDATQTELFLDGSGERITLPDNSTWTYDILVTARSATGTSGGYQLRGVIENNAGATALLGSVNKTVLAEDTMMWDANVVADDASDALVIRVNGSGGNSIRWVASVRTVEVIH